MVVSNFAPQVAETLRRIAPDIIRLEQYMDFVRNRTFRQTLLVHDAVAIRRRLDWRPVQECQIASVTKPSSDKPVLAQDAPESFQTADGSLFTTFDAITKAAMLVLSQQWPRSVPFAELLEAARGRLRASPATALSGPPAAQELEMLGVTMLQCYAAGVVELHVWSPQIARIPSSRPRASPLARIQATRLGSVTSLRHESATLDGLQREMLRRLDGSRDRAALLDELTALVQRGSLQIRHPQTGELITSGPLLAGALNRVVEECLAFLAGMALLVE
jgi:methyltransferase-like protein